MNPISIPMLRFACQQLITADFKTPRELVSWMGAMQAQDFNMAKWGIGVRLPETTDKDIENAMNRGEFVRTHILRPTWHFVSCDDIYWMLQLSAPRVKIAAGSADRALELTDEFILKTNLLITKILEKEPNLTRQEIGEKLQSNGIQYDNRRLNHIVFRAELDGIICNGTIRGKKQTYDLLENKIPKSDVVFDKDEALYKLAYKYFRSHGPATLQDFVWWSGLTTTDARKAIGFIMPYFITETIGSQIYLFHESCNHYNLGSDIIHFLPAFDETFVSYKDRKDTLALEHHKKVIVSNGIFHPTITKNGEVIGTWKKSLARKQLSIGTNYIQQPSREEQKLINTASDNLYAFYRNC